MTLELGGYAKPGFEVVADELRRTFEARDENGAAFAAHVDGELVVDLWGGTADVRSGRAWAGDTVQPIFSGSKGLLATCALLLIDRGELSLDDAIADHWPAFAANGKERVLVRHVLSHTAGLSAIRTRTLAPDDLLDAELMARTLADEAPAWEPGSMLGYHTLTFGWLVGELVRRVDGRPVGRFFAEEVAAPLGLDLWIGLPPEQAPRVAHLELRRAWHAGAATLTSRAAADPLVAAVYRNPDVWTPDAFDWWNAPATQRAGLPGAGAIGEARAIARLYACLARGGELDGVRLLRPETIAAARRELSRGHCPITDAPHAFGTGLALQTELEEHGPVPDAFGHNGAGGSVHGAWPQARAGFSYVTNRMQAGPDDDRARAVVRALWRAVAVAG